MIMARLAFLILVLYGIVTSSAAFQSDELLVDDDEFGLEGALPRDLEPLRARSSPSPIPSRKRPLDPDTDSKVQFSLEHSFGESNFSHAGIFSARLKTWNHGGQTLTKLRFLRNGFSDAEKKIFEKLLQADDFYRIRLPSNILNPPGREYVMASVRARCLPRETLDEHFIIHMDGVNILAVNYGSPGACLHPRQLNLPSKWTFNSHTVLKVGEQAPRTPMFTEEILGGESAEGELIQPPERSFWAKYWMYLIPLAFIVMNAITQAMNMAEEQAGGGQPGSQAAVQRGPNPAVRRR